MKSFKDPTFQERAALAAQAKNKALEQLRSKPKVDEAVLAERAAARAERERVQAEKSAARKAALKEAAEAKAAAKAAAIKATPVPLTEAELKARRDARYAARKNRK